MMESMRETRERHGLSLNQFSELTGAPGPFVVFDEQRLESMRGKRERHGLSLNRMSELTGVSNITLRYFEEGKTKSWDYVKIQKMERIYRLLDETDLHLFKHSDGYLLMYGARHEEFRLKKTDKLGVTGKILGFYAMGEDFKKEG